MRRLLAVLAFLAILPVQALAMNSRAGNSAQLAVIEAQERQIRGLSQLRPVPAHFPNDKQFNAILTKQSKRDTPLPEISLAQREMVLVGFLQPGQSLKKILFSDISAQVVGVYDYKTKVLYVRGQNNQAFKLERYVIVHEYTHALQDQHWNMKKLLPDEYTKKVRNSDAIGARHALIEGDAVNTQDIYIGQKYTPAEVQRLISYERGLPQGPALPWAIKKQFYFPYTTGVTFTQTLYRSGGTKAINNAFVHLPESTYEIIFPAAYQKGWKPTPVTLNGVKGFDGWKQTDDDVFGALGYKMLIWQYSTEKFATDILQEYRGDRYVFLQNGSQNAMLLRSEWADLGSAVSARNAISDSISKRFSGNVTKQGQSILVTPKGAVYLKVSGSTLNIAYAPTAALAKKLGKAQTT
jgi:hypothetical protein